MIWYLILYTLIVGVCGTGLGGAIGACFKKDNSKTMSLLLAFAAGIMLSIVCFDLIPSAISHSNVYITIGFIILGVGIIFILNFLIDRWTDKRDKHKDVLHPKTHDEIDELNHSMVLVDEIKVNNPTKQLLKAGIIMVLAIALHNFPEGLSIGSSFVHDNNTGILLAIIIALHNIPEGMAIVVPLVSGGMNRIKAISLTALSGLPTVFGAIFGYLIGGTSDLGLAISLSLAAGAMAYVVFGEILPESILAYKSKLPTFFVIFGLLLGLLLINVI